MQLRTHSLKLILCLWIVCGCLSASDRGHFTDPPALFVSKKKSKEPRVRTRLTVSPIVSFYTINEHHAKNPRQKMSGSVSLKEEIRLNNRHNTFLLFGIEYMVHGLNFNSYYFKPDSIQLYDGNFKYTYSLYIHEIDVPIQLKYSFTRENNSLVSPYIMIGYHFRTLLFGDLTVKQNGQTIVTKMEPVTFKNPLFTNRNNPFVSFTLGVQKNHPDHTRTGVYAEISYRIGFSPYLITDTFMPSSLFINGNHLAISLGVKF
ncbi:MAG: hypothetical protein ACXVPQ_00665 [Bacteroidia bacterium]